MCQLILGLALYGFSAGLMVRSGLGLNPWDVFHQGMAIQTRLSLGSIMVVTGVAVLMLWIPFRQRPGIGTICNILLIGTFADVSLGLIAPAQSLIAAWFLLLAGIFLNGMATGAYIGAGLGPGPRDGLMTALVNQTGKSVRAIRTGIELTVLGTGWLLGGTLGVGTAIYALAIGPIIGLMLPVFAVGRSERASSCGDC